MLGLVELNIIINRLINEKTIFFFYFNKSKCNQFYKVLNLSKYNKYLTFKIKFEK